MALIPPFYLDAVVAIGQLQADGTTTSWIGTGFLVADVVHREGDKVSYRLYLVTNRHVATAATSLQIRFNEAAGSTRQFTLDTSEGDTQIWYFHQDPEVDVAAAPLNPEALRNEGISFGLFFSDRHCLKRVQALDMGVTEGDGIFVLGFPMGMVGTTRNYVIVRQGCLARVRDALAGEERQFLIDA